MKRRIHMVIGNIEVEVDLPALCGVVNWANGTPDWEIVTCPGCLGKRGEYAEEAAALREFIQTVRAES